MSRTSSRTSSGTSGGTSSEPSGLSGARVRTPRRRGPLVAYGAAAVVTWVIVSTTFVAHRNHTYEREQLARARAAAAALAAGDAPLADVIAAGIVQPARAPAKYPFLKKRRLAERPGGASRTLGGVDAPESDKLLADAASAVERDGARAHFLTDGSGRVLAAVPAGKHGTAVVLANPLGRPAPYPALVIFGLMALGGLIAWLGARLGPRARTVGIGVGAALLAAPAAAWGGGAALALVLAAAALAAWADARGKSDAVASALSRHRVAYAYIGPAALGMGVLVLAPFVVGLVLGFFDHSRGEWHYVGLGNFVEILSGGGRAFSDPLNFWFTLVVTIAWTSINVALHVSIGVALALALREKWMRGRGVFRVLLILPWAIPNYITALIFRGMFQTQFGAINALLSSVGLGKVAWFSEFSTAFTANVVTNTWLGFPFMMIVALGALESIPRDLYEAAAVDGASAWARFTHITLPNLRPALMPAVVLGSIWTFNMFNVIYLVSGGKPGGSTDILVTQAYRWAFERGQRFGMAAAYATIIFLILVLWTLIANRLARSGPKEAT